MFDGVGRFRGYRCIVRDITERKRAVEESGHNQALLASIIENIPHMIFVKDAKTLKFVRFNQAGEQLLGYPRAELIGKSDYDFSPSRKPTVSRPWTAKYCNAGNSSSIFLKSRSKLGGREGDCSIPKVLINGDDGTPRYLLGISEDITERKHTECVERERVRALEQQQIALCELAKHDAIYKGNLKRRCG